MRKPEHARSYETENNACAAWVVCGRVTQNSSHLAIDMSTSDQVHRRWPRLELFLEKSPADSTARDEALTWY